MGSLKLVSPRAARPAEPGGPRRHGAALNLGLAGSGPARGLDSEAMCSGTVT